ncbi:MAG: 2-dehydropantoate 2-reductase [Deltaproteobacteria bacterium]|nr:2-dehydropantoate 2-reductase [Deltaproteobacteria bacterium]
MRIAIIGSGAIGGLFGARLSGSGADVMLFDVSKPLVEAITREGITIETPSGEKNTFPVKITDDIAAIGEVDLVVICVKGYHTQSAVKGALPIIGKETRILSIQNGVGNIETIADTMGNPGRVMGGSMKSNILPISFTHLLYSKGEDLVFGPMDGEVRQVHHDIAEIIQKSGFQVKVTDNIQGALWTKVSHNVMNALAAVLWMTNDEFMNYPSAVSVWEMAVKEAVDVAVAQGIILDEAEDPWAGPRKVYRMWHETGSKGKATTLQDLEMGRKTEVDIINGAVVEAGKRLNIPTPANDMLTLLVKAMEEKRQIG